MKQLKRSECAILPISLKSKRYNIVESGESQEEYLNYNPYWSNRLHYFQCGSRDKIPVVFFGRRYNKNLGIFFMISSIRKEYKSEHPEWGEPKGPHYVISLGERVELMIERR